MGKINGEKSDCCLRNLRNTCTFERERERERKRERERERERGTLCTFFNQALELYIFTSFVVFGERMDKSLRKRWSVDQTPQNRLNFAVFRKSQNLSIAFLLYSICEPVQHKTKVFLLSFLHFPSTYFEAATFLVHYSDDRPDLRDLDVE